MSVTLKPRSRPCGALHDTLERIDAADLNQNVAGWAALIYILAETELDFRAVER